MTYRRQPDFTSDRRGRASIDGIDPRSERTYFNGVQLLLALSDPDRALGTGANQQLIDLTPHITDLRLDETLSRPWDHFDTSLVFRGGMNTYICPTVGDWLIFKAVGAAGRGRTDSSALFFGLVREVSEIGTVGEHGVAESDTVKVTAVSWLEALSANQVVTALTATGSVGTFFADHPVTTVQPSGKQFSTNSWSDFIDSIIAAIDPQEPNAMGRSLTTMWKILGAMRVPQVLAKDLSSAGIGASLGDSIPVVYNDDSRKKYAPRLTADPVPGWGLSGIQSVFPNGQSSIDILMSTFQADLNMVELFPSLEPFEDTVVAAEDALGTSLKEYKEAETFVPTDAFGRFLKDLGDKLNRPLGALDRILGNVPATAYGEPVSNLAQALGANPVLIYRMKPFRTEELEDYVVKETSPTRFLAFASGKSITHHVARNIFRGVTWHRKNAKGKIVHGGTYSANDISKASFSYTESDHINSVSVNIPGQADSLIQWLASVGLPIQSTESIRQFGLRHFAPRWPFFPPLDSDKDEEQKAYKSNFMSGLFTIALQAAQFVIAADRFLRGTLEMVDFRPELRPGMTIEADVSRFVPRKKAAPAILTAYVDTVGHKISVDSKGVITGKTTVGYSRGSLDDYIRANQLKPLKTA